MSAEQLPHAPERDNERSSDLDQLAAERLRELTSTPEKANEHESQEARAEAAREAIDHHEAKAAEPVPQAETQPAEPKPMHPLLNPVLNYQHTLSSLQKHLKPVSRSFSKVIHNPAIENTSEALERTVARPSVINGALWTALAVGATFYLTARAFGYRLSGSEMLFALVAGALIGILCEIIWRAFKRS